MTRVAVVTAHYPPRLSGHGDFTSRLASSLVAQGMDVDVVVLGQEAVQGQPTLTVHQAPFPSGPKTLLAVVRTIAALKPDVVCLQFEANAFQLKAFPHLLPAALRARGMHVVMTYHELWAPQHLGRFAKAMLLNAPHRVIAFSRWHADGVNRFRRIGEPAEPIAVATNIATPVGDVRLLRARYGLDHTTILTFFGFVITAHCIEEIVTSLAKLRAEGRDVVLSVIGRFDPTVDGYHQSLVRLAEELEVSNAITWHGRVESDADVARLLALTDIGILPYDTGVGENNGAFAAFAQYGVATVTTSGERSTNMEQERVAEFVQPEAQEIAAAVGRLLDDSNARRSLGNRAKAWSERRTWERVAVGYRTVLERGPRQEIS